MFVKMLFAAAMALLAAFPLPAAADPPSTTISASGSATVSAPPDLAIVTFNLSTHGSTAEEAASSNNSIYAHFSTGMRVIGINPADVKTLSYNMNHVLPPPPCPPMPVVQTAQSATYAQPVPPCIRDPQSYGYFVYRSVSVTVHQLDLVGKVIDTAVAAGVNNVQGVSYGISDTRSLFLRALAQAIAMARAEGDAMAQAAGLHIVRVQSISSGYAPPPLRTIAGVASGALNAYAVPTQINPPSSLDVQATVSMNFIAQP